MAANCETSLTQVSVESVRGQLDKILVSPAFFRAPQMRRFLSFIVERQLSGDCRPEGLKETVIGSSVFGRLATYDPKSDPVVRVEARRLRAKLEEYYEGTGKLDDIRIVIPIGSYVPRWHVPNRETRNVERALQKEKKNLPTVFTALLVVGSITVWGLTQHSQATTRTGGRQGTGISSLAVLPFRNLMPAFTQEYIAVGLTDELTTDLARVKGLKVISPTTAEVYSRAGKDLPEIAHLLNVDAIVEGSVATFQGRVRVSAHLIRAASDTHLWADTYERRTGDIFDMQREIAQTITNQVEAAVQGRSTAADTK